MERKERKGGKSQLIVFLACLCLVASIIGGGSAEALVQADLDKLLSTKQCPNCDLSGANLSGGNLDQANLSGANLKEASLAGTQLNGANLSGATLVRAQLTVARLEGTQLSGANLSEAVIQKVSLKAAKLVNATLLKANLLGSDLSGAVLSNANLNGANLNGATFTGANLSGANLSGANLTLATLFEANLKNAILTKADMSQATWWEGSTWPDRTVCGEGSIGRCIIVPPRSKAFPLPSCPPNGCKLPDDPPAGSGTLAMMYYIVYEGENLLCVIETKETEATVPDGLLRYGRTYEYYILSISTTDEIMDYQGPVTFTVGPKPDKEDDYGNPLAGQTLRDAQGKTIALVDEKLSTLINAGSGVLPQAAVLSALHAAGGIVTDPSGKSVTMNTKDVHVARTNGGTDTPFVIAASDTNTIGTIKPLTVWGYTVDLDGKMKTLPDLKVAFSNVNLPFGLFDFNVLLDDYTNRAEVVIVPPVPFAAGTKWYKVATDGFVKEYPNFAVDANGNGILTLYDNDEWDKNPAWGIIRDPGGPGTPAAAGGGGGCFIATAAYGSYLHPFVNILRMFRDTVLLASSPGRAFVTWYYRVSPPIADVIARHGILSLGVRVLLLPVIGIAWLCLKTGAVPFALILLVFGAAIMVASRIAWRRR